VKMGGKVEAPKTEALFNFFHNGQGLISAGKPVGYRSHLLLRIKTFK
jgi:hypothetical protein